MNRPTERQLLRSIEQAERQVRAIKGRLPELLRRDAHTNTPDGFPRGGDSVRSTDIADPTFNAATARPEPDLVRQWTDELVAHVDAMCDAANAAASRVRLIEVSVDSHRGRQNTVTLCLNCGEPCLPHPKAGRCETCYRYRHRHNGDDRRPAPGETWVNGKSYREVAS